MKLYFIGEDDPDTTYHCVWSSEGGVWSIGLWKVMFGVRVVAWCRGSVGSSVDYCAGDNPNFMAELLATVRTIFLHLPESISERDVVELMPRWEIRPIDRDPCWPALQQLAQSFTGGKANEVHSDDIETDLHD